VSRGGHARIRAVPGELEEGRVYDHRLILRLWRFIRPHWLLLGGALLMLPLAAGLNLLQPYLVKLAIDDAIVPRQLENLATYAILLVGALLLERIARYAEILLLQLCGQRAMHDLRTSAHSHMISLAARFFDRTPVGRLMTRVTNDIESIAEAFSMGLVSVLGDILFLAGIVAAMLWLHPRLALLALSVVPVLLIIVAVFRRLIRAAQRVIRQRVAQINATSQEQISGMGVVQIFGRQQRAIDSLERANRAHRDAFLAAIRYDASLFALVELLSSLTVALLLWYGGVRVIDGTVTFGLLVAFIEYVQRFFIPIRDMSVKYMAMQQAMAAAERVFELLDNDDREQRGRRGLHAGAHPVAGQGAGPPASGAGAADVVFDQITFGYHEDQPVLRGVSFAVRPGERIAVVGATGSGKSTLVRLLARLYPLDSGRILLGGVDAAAIPLGELRRRVVVVSQDVILFTGTVAGNISLDDPAITREQVERAAERVGLTRLLALDREVQERGANLSAGERQLIAFARALARDPEVLVLDEATSSVDPEAEQLIQDGIAELLRERTSIVIAHRLTTIEHADRILVLHRGEIVEHGSHAELLEHGGVYSQLYQLQYVAPPEAG
jgi:ATP-binding cassette subfamily B protein